MWPSIVYQPVELARTLVGARVWRTPRPLDPAERCDYAEAALPLSEPVRRRSDATVAPAQSPAG
jgi:hypothetical protein